MRHRGYVTAGCPSLACVCFVAREQQRRVAGLLLSSGACSRYRSTRQLQASKVRLRVASRSEPRCEAQRRPVCAGTSKHGGYLLVSGTWFKNESGLWVSLGLRDRVRGVVFWSGTGLGLGHLVGFPTGFKHNAPAGDRGGCSRIIIW